MKNNIKLLFLNSVIILQVTGQPSLQYSESGKKTALKKNYIIKNNAHLETNQDQLLEFEVDRFLKVYLLPGSSMTLQGEYGKTGFQVEDLVFNAGQVYLESKSKTIKDLKPKSINFKSDFFNLSMQENTDIKLLFSLDQKKATLDVCNGAKPYQFNLLDHEIKPSLDPGQGISFQGKIENDKVAYDLLLDKRKVPKGEWTDKKTCSLDQVVKIKQDVLSKIKNQKEALLKKQQAALAEKKKRDGFYLCHEPYGNLDQCYFEKINDGCKRSRCNAEGKWKDAMDVSKSLCSDPEPVRYCEY